jgi:hypothetical protein
MLDLTFTPLVWLVILALAVFRVSWMLAREDGPFAIFDKLRVSLTVKAAKSECRGGWWTLSELSRCPLCLGIWISALLLILVTIPGNATKLITLFLAVSGLQSFLTLLIIKDE